MMREVTSLTGEIVIVDGKAVENVLVEPGERTEADDVTVPAGTIVAYTLRFPADYDGPVADAVIEVRGIECRTVGFRTTTEPARSSGHPGRFPGT